MYIIFLSYPVTDWLCLLCLIAYLCARTFTLWIILSILAFHLSGGVFHASCICLYPLISVNQHIHDNSCFSHHYQQSYWLVGQFFNVLVYNTGFVGCSGWCRFYSWHESKVGRASYTPQDKQLRVDPGAEAVAVWISQVCQRIQDSI